MTLGTVLLLGLGLGLRHATDADHVVMVSTLVQREPSPWRAARIAAFWGLGHTVTFLTLGLLIVLAGLELPPAFEPVAELAVAAMLIAFGVVHLARGGRRAITAGASASARPLAIGLVHGLAGSAGVALLAATTIAPRALAALYLGLVALGTVVGMVALTVAVARPLGWTVRREGRLGALLASGAALGSLGLGVLVLVRTLGAHL